MLRTNPTSNHIDVKFHWSSENIGKESVIENIESKHQMAEIFTEGLQCELFVNISKLLCS